MVNIFQRNLELLGKFTCRTAIRVTKLDLIRHHSTREGNIMQSHVGGVGAHFLDRGSFENNQNNVEQRRRSK